MTDDNDNVGLFDMDGTLADYDLAMYTELMELQSEYEPTLQITHMHDLPGAWEARRTLIKQVPGFWLKIPKLQLGFDVLRAAHELGFGIEILTKGPRNATLAWKEKVEWCTANIPVDYDASPAVVSEKSRTYGKFLCDDWPPYVTGWLRRRPRGFVIAPAHEYNTFERWVEVSRPHISFELTQGEFDAVYRPRILRYDGSNLDQVWQLLLAIYRRAPGESIVWQP